MAPKYSTISAAVAAQDAIKQSRPGLVGVAPASGPGVLGIGKDGDGVEGFSDSGAGVSGYSKTGTGIYAFSEAGEAIHAENNAPLRHTIAAYHKAAMPDAGGLGAVGAAIYGESKTGYAAQFSGKVQIVGDLSASGKVYATDMVLSGADCAEYFETQEAEAIEAGAVVVLDDDGSLRVSRGPYDKRVAGIVSGAGTYRPGVILGHDGSDRHARPVALSGRVYCRVDAEYGEIEIGDLLTTSLTPGHAMKASDPVRAFGTVIGKAMAAMKQGRGLIPVLVGLL